jgi:UDP-2,3-diacylglucosamine hydrolase
LIYFASDLHLGTPTKEASAAREKLFVAWLKEVSADAAEIYVVGDLFDFWHEYKTVVPKGFVRVQAALAEAVEKGIAVHIFTGNHDLWMGGYLEEELGVQVHYKPIVRTYSGKQFFIGHGDGLGPKDYGYKFIKKVFTNKILQWAFRWLHPDVGMRVANYFSYKSRFASGEPEEEKFEHEDREWLVQYARRKLKEQHYDYFIFGHRHLPLNIQLNEKSRYINLGDWLTYFSYAVFDGTELSLKYYKQHK